MQVKVNMEIRDIENEFAFGLTIRKLITVILIGIVVIPAYTVLEQKVSVDTASLIVGALGIAIGVIGFGRWHKMRMEQALLYLLYTLLCPKQLVFQGENVYDNDIQALCKAERACRKEKKDAV